MKKIFILLMALMLVFVFTASVWAAAATAESPREVGIYGRASVDTYWRAKSKEQSPAPNTYDDDDLQWEDAGNYGNMRLGWNFKEGDIGGKVEIRARNASYLRHWYGTWNFGPGTLVIGQTWVPTFACVSGVMHETGNSILFGDWSGGSRRPGLQLWFPTEMGTLKIGAMEPNFSAAGTVVAAATDLDYTLPRLEASMAFKKFGPVGFTLFAGYNTYSEVITATDKEYDIDTWVVGGLVSVDVGPFTFKGLLWDSQNVTQFGMDANAGNPFNPQLINDSVEDTDTLGFFLVGLFKASDMVSVEVGYGRVKSEIENGAGVPDSEDVDQMYYVSVPISVAKGLTITPEIIKYDYKDIINAGVSTDEGDAWVYGINWLINF
jgi:hypothetical protein